MTERLKVPKWLYGDASKHSVCFAKVNGSEYCIYGHKKGWAIAEKKGDIIKAFAIPPRIYRLTLKEGDKGLGALLTDIYHCARLDREWTTIFRDYEEQEMKIRSEKLKPLGQPSYSCSLNPIILYGHKVKICRGGSCMPK